MSETENMSKEAKTERSLGEAQPHSSLRAMTQHPVTRAFCQPNPLQQTGYLQTIHHLSHKTLILKAIWYGLTLFIMLVSDSQKAQNWLQRFLCYGNDKSEIMSLRSRFLNIQPFVNVKWNFSSYRYCT